MQHAPPPARPPSLKPDPEVANAQLCAMDTAHATRGARQWPIRPAARVDHDQATGKVGPSPGDKHTAPFRGDCGEHLGALLVLHLGCATSLAHGRRVAREPNVGELVERCELMIPWLPAGYKIVRADGAPGGGQKDFCFRSLSGGRPKLRKSAVF